MESSSEHDKKHADMKMEKITCVKCDSTTTTEANNKVHIRFIHGTEHELFKNKNAFKWKYEQTQVKPQQREETDM